MTATLNQPEFASIINRLFADAQLDAERRQGISHPTDYAVEDRGAAFQHVYLSVAPESGQLLYSLVRAVKPTTIVEYGMSYGISTLHLAAAVRDNGTGHIITTEMSSHKLAAARATFAEAGVTDLITILEGDARATLETVSGPVQFVLLDGWPDLDLTVIKILEPVLAPGALIVGDNVNLDPTRAYLNYVRAPENGYVSTPVALDKGLDLAVRV
jgi:predicted O-methyltransferase YrrM